MLEFSPDLDARLCYLLVLACAIISARVQVLGRLEPLKQKIIYAWGQRSTWLVFTIYLLLPLALFWFLDRTGAIKDTSVFAALLVGLAYPAILSGGTSLKPTDGLAGVLGWLNKAVDGVVVKTTSMVALRAQLFERVIVDHLAKDANARTLVEELALQYAASRDDVRQELAQHGADTRAQAQTVYDHATGSAVGLKPITELLPKLKVRAKSPYGQAKSAIWGYALLSAGVALAAVIVAFIGPMDVRFYAWRITKPGISDLDLHRTRVGLAHLLSHGGERAAQIRERLLGALQRPGLDTRRADQVLQLLIAHRGSTTGPSTMAIAHQLTDGLRASAVDIRARIHHTLLFLADEMLAAQPPMSAPTPAAGNASVDGVAPEPQDKAKALGKKLNGLREWKPLATESPIDLERRWHDWNDWWRAAAPAGM
jgi:hypothetical protein